MAQIMAIDYGMKRTGIAVTDDLQMIASGIETVETSKIMFFLDKYCKENRVEALVVGQPIDLKGNDSEIETQILKFIAGIKVNFPEMKVYRWDERFTSKMASYYISQSGKNKKQRQDKGLIDKVSATIILQNFLEYSIR